MNKKCEGCGSLLQTKYKSMEGYVKEEKYNTASLCERCFKIKHYGKNDIIDIKYDSHRLLRDLSNQKVGLIYLIDILNLNENNKEYLKYLKKEDIVVLTKKDLLPKSVKDKKIISYFKENYKTEADVLIISSKKKYNIDTMLKILENNNKKEYYCFGFTNSGKSTFINTIIESVGKKGNITVSAYPNTTAEYIKIKVNDNLTLIDTPGFIDKNSITNYLNSEDIKYIMPKKEIKPKILQTKPNFTVILENILRIENIDNNKTNLIFYMNNNLNYKKIKITTTDSLKSLPKKYIELKGDEDIIINGLGFIKVTKESKLVIYTLDESIISLRKKMI